MPARLTVGHSAGAAPATRATSWALAVPRVPAPPVQAGTPSPGQPLPLQTGQDDSRAVGEVCFDITPLVCPAYLLAEGTSVCEWDGAQQGVGTQTGKLPRGPVSQEKGCCSFLPGGAVLSPTLMAASTWSVRPRPHPPRPRGEAASVRGGPPGAHTGLTEPLRPLNHLGGPGRESEDQEATGPSPWGFPMG